MEGFTSKEDSGDLYLEGYFAVFGKRYELWPGAYETIAPGAFRDCLTGDVRALYNHNDDLVLGRTANGTLELREDGHGLWGRVKINREDSDALNVYHRILRGDVNQCSFGFNIDHEIYSEQPDGTVEWTIKKVNPLYEISPCTFPAYEDTAVSARRRDLNEIQRRKTEKWRETIRKQLKGEQANGA